MDVLPNMKKRVLKRKMRHRRDVASQSESANDEKEYPIGVYNLNAVPESAEAENTHETLVTLLCKSGTKKKRSTEMENTISMHYGVASVSRIDKIVGLFAKEPYKKDNVLQKRL